MDKRNELLAEFLDNKTIKALSDFLNESKNYSAAANIIATAFGASKDFSKMEDERVKKLVSSFKNNFTLLIQKTWVEKSDIALKDQLLYQLNIFLGNENWKDNYVLFLQLINQGVELMFGQKPESPEFAEYSLRIDPEFGIFWWYISNLPPKADWSEEKCRLAMMLGMFFLANY